MAYTFKQRQDGGFDFFNGGQKTRIEDYVKNTGANQNQLRQMMAQKGDQQSRQILGQRGASVNAPSTTFNFPGYDQGSNLTKLPTLNTTVRQQQGDQKLQQQEQKKAQTIVDTLKKNNQVRLDTAGNRNTDEILGEYNNSDVYKQRQMLDTFKNEANSAHDRNDINAAREEQQKSYILNSLKQFGKQKAGNGRTFFEDIGNGIRDTVVNTGETLGRGFSAATGENRDAASSMNSAANANTDLATQWRKAGRISDEYYKYMIAKADQDRYLAGRMLDRDIDASDPIKMAGAVTNAIALPVSYAAGLGAVGKAGMAGLGAITKEAAGTVLPSVLKSTPTQLLARLAPGLSGTGLQTGGAILENVISSAPQSISDVAMQKGSQATFGDYATSQVGNLVSSAALPGASAVAGKVLSAAAKTLNTPAQLAKKDPSVLAFDMKKQDLTTQLDTLPKGSIERQSIYKQIIQNDLDKANQARLVQRQLAQEGSIKVPATNVDTSVPIAKKQTIHPEVSQNQELLQRSEPLTEASRLLPNNADTLSSNSIISPLQLSIGQAKQRFRKLNRDGTPFEVANPDNSKPGKPFIVGESGVRKGGAEGLPDIDYTKLKDRSALGLGRETMERNLDRVAGDQSGKLKSYLVDTSRKNETDRIMFTNQLRKTTKSKIVDELGVKPRSKESALVQKYGEKSITLEELKAAAPDKWQNIVQASDHFRKQYDELLDRWNAVRQEYGYDPVPKRKDYFRHFEDLSKTGNIVGIIKNSRDLPTSISGITDVFKPNKPFSNAELRRLGNKTDYDAVTGFENYVDSISRQIYHTDTVQRGRAFEGAIRQASETSGVELPNFVANLSEWTNLVSGKKTRIDRASEQLLGRKVYAATNWLRSRVGANMVGANISSALTNFVPLTQALATTSKPSALRGIADTLGSAFQKDHNMIDGVRSDFLTRRFPEGPLNESTLSKAARIPFAAVDGFSSRTIVASKYFENKAQGMSPQAAMKAADDYAGKIITDRSIGQLPNLLETKTTGFLTQFQTEVNNQVSVLMRDIPEFKNGNKAKIAGALAQVFLYSYLYNEAYSAVTGRRVAIDPIKFGLDLANPDKDGEQKLGSFSDNILNALPGVSLLGGGGRLPISAAMPDFESIVSGVGNIGKDNGAALGQILKGVSGPAAYLLPKYGGGQIKKTTDDIISQLKGYSETPTGKVRFTMPDDPLNITRGAVFGQYSTPGGQEYVKNGIKPMSDSKSEVLKALPSSDRQDYFNSVSAQKEGKGNSLAENLAKINSEKDKKKIEFEKGFSADDFALYNLSEADRQKAIDAGIATEDKFNGLDNYAKGLEKKLGLSKLVKIDTKLDKKSDSYSFLVDSKGVSDKDKDNWRAQAVDPKYQKMIDTINSNVPEGLPKLPTTNAVAELYAEFQKNSKDKNWSKLQLQKESKTLMINAYKTDLRDNAKFLSGLSDKELISAYRDGMISKDEMDRVIGVDNIIHKLGGSQMIGNKVRAAMGYGSLYSGSGSGGGGSRKANIAKAMAAQKSMYDTQSSTMKALNDLLQGTTVRRKLNTGNKVALKQIVVKGEKK